ncbi:MAG: hypothetical protein EP297_06190 [Gammaproteobacteria bacterium]|nr:MAG: hypothetical protein EP297_06190 [Gammaproteobacteria bacterium]
MLTFTLDTSCINAIDKSRDEAGFIQNLMDAHIKRIAEVGVVAISVFEDQHKDGHLERFSTFKEHIESLGLEKLELLYPMFYWDVTFWDASIKADDKAHTLESKVHNILYPDIPFLWTDYCHEHGIDPESETLDEEWRNAKCAVQSYWCHAIHGRHVFVTSNKNFYDESKKKKLLELAGGYIETPECAAALVH